MGQYPKGKELEHLFRNIIHHTTSLAMAMSKHVFTELVIAGVEKGHFEHYVTFSIFSVEEEDLLDTDFALIKFIVDSRT